MKEYQNLIGKIIIGASIIMAAVILADAVKYAGGEIGSMIASAISSMAAQLN